MAALLTTMSTRPNSARARSASRRTSADFPTSAISASARTPRFLASPTTASAAPALARVLTMTSAPRSASSKAMARPMLRPPPVTRATRPLSLVLSSALTITVSSGSRHRAADQAEHQIALEGVIEDDGREPVHGGPGHQEVQWRVVGGQEVRHRHRERDVVLAGQQQERVEVLVPRVEEGVGADGDQGRHDQRQVEVEG